MPKKILYAATISKNGNWQRQYLVAAINPHCVKMDIVNYRVLQEDEYISYIVEIPLVRPFCINVYEVSK